MKNLFELIPTGNSCFLIWKVCWNMSTCERGFQKKKRRFLPGIEPASSVVDSSIPHHQTVRATRPKRFYSNLNPTLSYTYNFNSLGLSIFRILLSVNANIIYYRSSYYILMYTKVMQITFFGRNLWTLGTFWEVYGHTTILR
jgi:hypothetical protein